MPDQAVVVDPSEVQQAPTQQGSIQVDPSDVTIAPDPAAVAAFERAPGIPLYQTAPGPPQKELPPLTATEALLTNPPKQLGSTFMGASSAANLATANIAGLLDVAATKISDLTGYEKGGLFKHIEDWARQQQVAQQRQAAELAGGRTDAPSQIYRAAGNLAFNAPTYAVATELGGGATGGMALMGALETANQGWKNMLKAAGEGAFLGKFMDIMGPAKRWIRVPVVLGTIYQNLVSQGADPETAFWNASSMAAAGGLHPGEVGLRDISKLPLTPRLLTNTLTPQEQASQAYMTQRGVETPLSMQTGSKAAAGLEGTVQNLPGGGMFAEKMKTAKEQLTEAGRQELPRISPQPVTAEEAGSAVGGKLASDLERQRGILASQVSPTPSSPELAGTKVLEAGKKKIRQLDQAADESYKAAWIAERDPRNIQTVPTYDKYGREVLDEEGSPVTEKMALPIDVSDVQRALKPIADRYERTLSDTDAHASLGLKAMRNFIKDAPVRPLSAVELDLGMFKEAARNENIPELRDTSQGLAAASVKALQAKIDETMANAAYPGWDPAGGTPSPALRHLQAGRAATAQKHAIADVFAGFGRRNLEDLEPVGVHRALTWGGDAGIQRLRDVAAIAPETMPEVGRAFIDGGGNWETLGPETKKLLVRDPKIISGLDKYYADVARFGPLTKLEPVDLFNRLTASMGKRINLLREVAKETPEQMPQVARAFVQGMLDRVTREGDIQKVQSTLDKWNDLDPESKAAMFKSPATAAFEKKQASGVKTTEAEQKAAVADRKASAALVNDLDSLFFSLKRLTRNVNPSGSGFIGALTQMKGNIFKGLGLMGGGIFGYGHGMPGAGVGTGAGYLAGAAGEYATNAGLARLLFNPKFTRLLTEGLRLDMAGNSSGAGLIARTLAKMIPGEEEPPEGPPTGGGPPTPPAAGGGGGADIAPDDRRFFEPSERKPYLPMPEFMRERYPESVRPKSPQAPPAGGGGAGPAASMGKGPDQALTYAKEQIAAGKDVKATDLQRRFQLGYGAAQKVLETARPPAK
jgi:hypothetical protein